MLDTVAEREGLAISKSNRYRTKTPKKTKASFKPVPRHMRPEKKAPTEPAVPTYKMNSWLKNLLSE